MLYDDMMKKLKNFTLLYVEDDKTTVAAISVILESFFKEVFIGYDGVEGFALYEEKHPDIVLTDIQMPNMNGFEMSRKIKAKNPEQIVLLFTAYGDRSYLVDAINIGINGYIFKPLDDDLFLHTLAENADKVTLQHKKKELENRLTYIATYDNLTNLFNRTMFIEMLEKLMYRSNRTDENIALLFIDVDDFKNVNDTYGHNVGDIALKHVANTLSSIAREEDVVSRISGDEFAMILWGIKHKNDIYNIINRILADIDTDISYEEHTFKISLSIGITFYPQDVPIGANALLRQADSAMYKAKNSGKGTYDFFDLEQNKEMSEKVKKILEVQNGLKNGEFELYYQAQSDIKSGKILGFEALIRWNHSTKGIVAPDNFLPYINDQEFLMKDLSKYVLNRAFSDIEKYNKKTTKASFSINITSYDIASMDFISYLHELFEKYNVAPKQIELEILESSAISDILVAKKVFQEIQKMGIKIAIDDFGTGYASLIYLQELSVDIVKIDTSFIFKLLKDKKSYAIVKAAIVLAQSFGYSVVAEGVENEEILHELKQLDCDIAQGYFISKPIPFAEIL